MTSSSGSAASSSKSTSARATPRTYSALRVEKPRAVSSLTLSGRDTVTSRKRDGVLAWLPVTIDETAARTGERRVQRDLLRGDRRHQRLERVGRERRAESGKAAHRVGQNRVCSRELPERGEVQLQPEQLPHDWLDRVVERLDVDTVRRRGDPHLASVHDAVETAFVPEVGAVDTPEHETVERQLEVVRLGDRERGHRCSLRDDGAEVTGSGASLTVFAGLQTTWRGNDLSQALREDITVDRFLRPAISRTGGRT